MPFLKLTIQKQAKPPKQKIKAIKKGRKPLNQDYSQPWYLDVGSNPNQNRDRQIGFKEQATPIFFRKDQNNV